jgi:hypothetical protein
LTQNKARFPIIYNQGGEQDDYRFIVDMGIKGKLKVKLRGEFLAVSVSQAKEEYFGDAVGLMGEFQTGHMIGRDSAAASFEQDPNAFGFDWQVHDTEIKLFRETKGPQHPIKCKKKIMRGAHTHTAYSRPVPTVVPVQHTVPHTSISKY